MEMTKGNLWKQIWVYSLPLMFTNLLQVFFNLADVAVVGKFAGPIALGGVGSTTLLVTLTTGFMIGMGNGVNTLTALFIGANEKKQESKTVHTGFLLCAGMGIAILLMGVILANPILKLLGTKPELFSEASVYFRLYMLGSPALALYNYGNAVLSAAGDTKRPLKYLTIAGVINVILNLVFVIGFKLNAAGVALASMISQYISAILILRALLITTQDYRLCISKISYDTQMAGRILRISIPAALQYSLFAVANLVVQSAVNTFDHVTVEGNSAAMNADTIVYDMMAAFYTACASFIAQNYGAGKKKRILKSYLITMLYSFLVGLILGVLLFVFKNEFLFLFTDDKDVIARGAIRLGIMSLSYCVSAFMDNATAGARGLGKTFVPTIAVILGSVVYRVIWILTVFTYFRTLQSLYLLYVTAWTMTAIIENIYFFCLYRKIE